MRSCKNEYCVLSHRPVELLDIVCWKFV